MQVETRRYVKNILPKINRMLNSPAQQLNKKHSKINLHINSVIIPK